ncbi:MAG: RNA polymerase sigma factor [Actinomycetes bacterium]
MRLSLLYPEPDTMDSPDFSALLADARAGHETAFTVLFRTVQPGLLRYLRVVAGQQAEDVAAETWVQVVRDLASFTGDEAAFRAWVYAIARHRFLDARRASARRPETLVSEPEAPDAAPDAATVAEEMFSTERAVALVASLPADQAEVVMLRVVAGLDVATVASVTGRTANHVRVLSHRGLRRLAHVLGEARTAPL